MFEIICLFVGFFMGFLIFFKRSLLTIPKELERCKQSDDVEKSITISVIIPARNEEINISLILNDLKNQTLMPLEIICVNDCSEDDTSKVARSFSVNIIDIKDKPSDWVGKSWACNCGASIAKGDLFLFLDADVRLAPEAIAKLINTYGDKNSEKLISVQPYHKPEKLYEQLSFFFNLNLIAANGVGLPFKVRNAGLFGPVILIPSSVYKKIGGHESVKHSVIEDLQLGEVVRKRGYPIQLFWGNQDFSFRMYRNGIKDLFWGWSKNFASGAFKTSPILVVFMFFWFYSATGVSIILLKSILSADIIEILKYGAFYLAWVIELLIVSSKVGNFNKVLILFYPLLLFVYFMIFATSIIKKIFHIKTIWKGRKISVSPEHVE